MSLKRITQVSFFSASLLVSTAWAETLCEPTPLPNCEKGQQQAWVKLKANGKWMAKWHKGSVASFGNPTESDELNPSTSYDLCLYVDESLVLDDRAAAGAEWSAAGPNKVKYKSNDGNIRKMMIKVPANDKGNSGKGKIKAKGVLPEEFTLPLEVGASVTMQFLQIEAEVIEGEEGEEVEVEAVTACWGAEFGLDGIKHNSSGKFQARNKKAKPPKD